MQPWDRSAVEISISDSTFHRWLHDIPSSGDEIVSRDGVANGKATACSRQFKKLLLLFGMDGDFAPMVELVKLRKKYDFLLVLDDAHGTFVCGKSGEGVAEEFNCESDVDICIGTLSKAAGCHGGFIACRQFQEPGPFCSVKNRKQNNSLTFCFFAQM
ncbi:hypothetical protein Patl1_20734 [Pistacia atlantica]|uniref:Uncharacterized protein n=1 Tax=Pistacia atlantica TaxID=434234 RepID=A0ACC1BJZ0_9ROSI|nr:hypothetical protein Patl1_20734 [Pistacia atlantica]